MSRLVFSVFYNAVVIWMQLLLFESESSPAGARVFTLDCFLTVFSWEVVEPLEDKAWLLAKASHCTLRVTASDKAFCFSV